MHGDASSAGSAGSAGNPGNAERRNAKKRLPTIVKIDDRARE
jgi:hypothetical protein